MEIEIKFLEIERIKKKSSKSLWKNWKKVRKDPENFHKFKFKKVLWERTSKIS